LETEQDLSDWGQEQEGQWVIVLVLGCLVQRIQFREEEGLGLVVVVVSGGLAEVVGGDARTGQLVIQDGQEPDMAIHFTDQNLQPKTK
jgi:hypothetical protein